MNARNLLYIKKFNDKKASSLADSKIKTKTYLSARGVPFAETYALIRSKSELQSWDFDHLPGDHFVIKPNEGSKWEGILVLEKKGEVFSSPGWRTYTKNELRAHMADILDGAFSLGSGYDSVLIEEKLVPDETFRHFCQYGLADIRLIVFNLVPVAAMVRMPTAASGGKANLAQWWAAFGVDVATGEIHSFFQNKVLYSDVFPEKYRYLREKKLSYWNDILLYSSQIQIFANIGYLALDWVITPTGPKLLELNARAGLEVQNVNGIPLRSRLRQVENLGITDPVKGVEVARSLFHERPVFHVQENKILYTKQKWILQIWSQKYENTDIFVDLSRPDSRWNGAFFWENTEKISVKTYDGAELHLTSMTHDSSLLAGTLVLGSQDVEEYYLKPVVSPNYDIVYRYTASDWHDDILVADQALHRLGRKINLSHILKPTNYYQELDVFASSQWLYNPVFQYDFPDKDFFKKISQESIEVQNLIQKASIQNETLWSLFQEKFDEVSQKIELVRGFSRENPVAIRESSERLFWIPDEDLLILAKEKTYVLDETLKNQKKLRGKLLSPDELINRVTAQAREYGFPDVPVAFRDNNFSRISISYGKNIRINLSRNARIYEKELDAILAHEIGVHMQRYIAGQSLGLKLFQHGTGYYISDEEWLAIYESLKHLPDGYEKNAMYIKYYLSYVAKTMNFSDLARLIQTLYPEKTPEQVFSDTTRVKRGIRHTQRTGIFGYMKDTVYLPGYLRMKKWVESGADPYMLFQAKIKIEDIPFITPFFK